MLEIVVRDCEEIAVYSTQYTEQPPYICKYCGEPTWVDPTDQPDIRFDWSVMNLELIKQEADKFFPADATLSLGGAISFAKHCVEKSQPRLTVRLESYPESNGKRNWTAMFARTKPFDGLVGSSGGITIARGEYWNRVAFEAERAKFLIGERDTEPFILDYGDDIRMSEEWAGESSADRYKRKKPTKEAA